MNSFKTQNIKKLRSQKTMYKLLLRQRRCILNLLQQNNYQDNNNMRVDNLQNALIDNHSSSIVQLLYRSNV